MNVWVNGMDKQNGFITYVYSPQPTTLLYTPIPFINLF
jgi:hypothetical protein